MMIFTRRTTRFLVPLLAALVFAAQPAALAAKAKSEPKIGECEVKMGQESAAEVAKEKKLSDNAADLKRVRDIGDKIAAVANKKEVPAVYGTSKITPFQYQFNIIEAEDINAFSVPGGHIYIYRGLLNFVESDQELAGVIAHEIIHASHHHMVYLLTKQAAMNNEMAIALLATMLVGAKASDMGNVVLGVQLLQIARLNGYGMQAERDSDQGAILYLREAGYNPVGLLTFLERLAKRPEFADLGIYRSHPMDKQRVAAARIGISDLGLPINRRDTTKAIKAEVKVETIEGAQVSEVAIKDKVIFRPAPAGGKTGAQRAAEVADRINKALDSGLQIHEIKVDPSGGGVLAREQPLVVISDAEAKLMGKTPAQASREAVDAIRAIIWQQMVNTLH